MQQIHDALVAPTGEFLLKVYRRGILIEEFLDKNLIVNNSKQIHAKLLGGAVANQSVTQIGFGTNSAAAQATDTVLTNAYIKALDNTTYPTTNQVAFAFSLGTTEFNGNALFEFGLFTAGGLLYAHKVRASALNKDTDLSLSGSWTITF